MDRQLLSYDRAAKVMGIGTVRLKRLIEDGKIGVCFIEDKKMIPASEIASFITKNTFVVTNTKDSR